MNLQSHVALSAVVGGGLSVAEGDPWLLGVTMAAGVLPDADHAIDFYNWYIRRSPHRLILLFHGWEYLAIAIAIYSLVLTEPWMLGIVIGYATQIVGDQIFNRAKWHTYLITARAANRFRWEGIVEMRAADQGYESLMRSVPIFREPIRSWFERRRASLPAGDFDDEKARAGH